MFLCEQFVRTDSCGTKEEAKTGHSCGTSERKLSDVRKDEEHQEGNSVGRSWGSIGRPEGSDARIGRTSIASDVREISQRFDDSLTTFGRRVRTSDRWFGRRVRTSDRWFGRPTGQRLVLTAFNIWPLESLLEPFLTFYKHPKAQEDKGLLPTQNTSLQVRFLSRKILCWLYKGLGKLGCEVAQVKVTL